MKDEDVIRQHLRVTRVDVAAAKAFVMRAPFGNTKGAVLNWLKSLGFAPTIDPISLSQDDCQAELERVARHLSLQSAGFLAMWELVHASLILPAGGSVTHEHPEVRWTTARPGHGGRSGSWVFQECSFSYFEQSYRPAAAESAYTDGDLFLAEVAIADLHEGVAVALRDAAACFRNDLYTPCVAMLGAAAEGAWIELGEALLPVFEAGSSGVKYRETLRSQGSVTNKVELVQKLWAANPIGPVRNETGIGTERLGLAAEWTDTVRRSRNVLHWGVEATTPNSYDKVATMMLTTPVHLRALYDARRATLAFAERGRAGGTS